MSSSIFCPGERTGEKDPGFAGAANGVKDIAAQQHLADEKDQAEP